MKVFFDTEFTRLQKNADLISIGLISEDYRSFYAEFTDYELDLQDEDNKWVVENVINKLYRNKPIHSREYIPNYHTGTKSDIAIALWNWFLCFNVVELVSDVCQYDMVLLSDIFGGSMNLPFNVSPACHDINQDIAEKYGLTSKQAFEQSREEILFNHYKENTVPGDKHNALHDAKVIREIYQILHGVDYDKIYHLS